jgi:hypothetical protein
LIRKAYRFPGNARTRFFCIWVHFFFHCVEQQLCHEKKKKWLHMKSLSICCTRTSSVFSKTTDRLFYSENTLIFFLTGNYNESKILIKL